MAGFAQFKGALDARRLDMLVANAAQYRIKVDFKHLSSTHGGFATRHLGTGSWKMRVVVHQELDVTSRFGVLCHELAHILLGHLGTDHDAWWYSRTGLDHPTVEIEAEAVAFIVTSRQGLRGPSDAYLSSKLTTSAKDEGGKVPIPPTVSCDMIAKTAALIEKMATETTPQPKARPPPPPPKLPRAH